MDLPTHSIGIKFISSRKGKPVLLSAGFRYNFVKKNKNGHTNWRCYNKMDCNTSVTLDIENKIVKEAVHSCIPDVVKNEIDSLMDECKKSVCTNLKPIPKLFEDFIGSAKCDLPEDDIPTFTEKKDSLYRARKAFLNLDRTTCKNLKDLKLPDHLADNFFLFDDGTEEKILFFCTPLAKSKFKVYKCYYGDGTFKVAPRLFYQLYTLHINASQNDDTVNFVPLIYILLPNKTQATYERLFTILRDQFLLNIEQYKCDYELAVIQAVNVVYPNAKVTGCYFHYWKALSKKSKNVGLKDIDGGDRITRMYMQLALLPPIMIPEGFLAILELNSSSAECTTFSDYFSKQWIILITTDKFSCYKEIFRTNNPIEGWHGRLKNRIPVKPPLYRFIQLLKKEAQYQDKNLRRIETFCKGKRRSLKLKEKDIKIDLIITSALKNEITVLECLERLCRVNLIR